MGKVKTLQEEALEDDSLYLDKLAIFARIMQTKVAGLFVISSPTKYRIILKNYFTAFFRKSYYP